MLLACIDDGLLLGPHLGQPLGNLRHLCIGLITLLHQLLHLLRNVVLVSRPLSGVAM
jgi:hypothetical protein